MVQQELQVSKLRTHGAGLTSLMLVKIKITMALSPKTIKYIAITVVIVVAGLMIGMFVWDLLKTAIGLLLGFGLVYIGVRVMFGKGLPKQLEKVVNKATGGDPSDKKEDE